MKWSQIKQEFYKGKKVAIVILNDIQDKLKYVSGNLNLFLMQFPKRFLRKDLRKGPEALLPRLI